MAADSGQPCHRLAGADASDPLGHGGPQRSPLLDCEATREEWNAFLDDENQELRPTSLQWIDGGIYIVEFPSNTPTAFAAALARCVHGIPDIRDCLAFHRSIYLRSVDGVCVEPSESFGPKRLFTEPLCIHLLSGMDNWGQFSTLVADVGVSRDWGVAPGSLDWKATCAWPRVPGVAFVLCVAVDPNLQSASYKLYELPAHSVIDSPTEFAVQSTVVQIDMRRLLSLPQDETLPPQIPDLLTIDLFHVLVDAREQAGID